MSITIPQHLIGLSNSEQIAIVQKEIEGFEKVIAFGHAIVRDFKDGKAENYFQLLRFVNMSIDASKMSKQLGVEEVITQKVLEKKLCEIVSIIEKTDTNVLFKGLDIDLCKIGVYNAVVKFFAWYGTSVMDETSFTYPFKDLWFDFSETKLREYLGMV